MPESTLVPPAQRPNSLNGASNCVPHLDPPETNPWGEEEGSITPLVCPGPGFHERSHAVRVLSRLKSPALLKTAGKIAACCMGAYLAERADGTLAVVPGCCRQRLCPHCQRARSARIYAQLQSLLAEVDRPRMMTLTLLGAANELLPQLDKLYSSFRRLRETSLWKGTVLGAIAVVEIKRGSNSGRWHAHMHVLWKGGFIPHAKLKAEWHRITGDSYIVHLGGSGSKHEICRYLAKYASKPADVYSLVDADVREFAFATKGRRLIITSGCWHGSGLGGTPKLGASKGCEPLISLRALLDGHRIGIVECTETLCLLASLGATPKAMVPFNGGLSPPESVEQLVERRAATLDAARDAWRALKDHDHAAQLAQLTAPKAHAS